LARLIVVVAGLSGACAHAAGALGPAALRARHAGLTAALADNAFGAQLVLQSEEAHQRIDGDIYAVLEHPLPVVAGALADPAHWCDVMILHLNTKQCRRVQHGEQTRLEVHVGTKHEQSLASATLLAFAWQPPQHKPDYFAAEMKAPDGPYDTRDYRLLVEAVPLDGGRTFLHMAYALSYGGASQFAMKLYLGTLARDKVGFTPARPTSPGGQPVYVDGLRGVVERNTMRYYLAIRSYLDALPLPPDQQAEQRFAAWFDATEKYPRQLHEVDREAYLRMKRAEWRRQLAAKLAPSRCIGDGLFPWWEH
jgi:hypothetical protein